MNRFKSLDRSSSLSARVRKVIGTAALLAGLGTSVAACTPTQVATPASSANPTVSAASASAASARAVASQAAAASSSAQAASQAAAVASERAAAAASQQAQALASQQAAAAAQQPAAPPSGGNNYTNVNGNTVPGPVAAPAPPAGATAKCNDGTYSFSQHRQGTCSSHGGVANWL